MKKALSLEQTVNRFLLCVAVWIFLQSIITPRLTALAPMLSALYVPVLQLTRLVSFLIPLRLFLGKPPKGAEIRRPAPSKGTFAGWLLVGLGIYLLIHLLLEVSGLNALTGQSFRRTVSEPIAAYAWFFLFAVLWEEVAFRRYFCGYLVRYDPQLAVLVSSVVFAMLHGDLVRSAHSFVFGLLTGYLYLTTGRFLCPYLLHFFANLFWNLYFTPYHALFPGRPYDLCALAVLSVGLIALPILISAYAGRNRPDLSMLTQCRQALRHMALEKAKFRAALTTPGMALAYTLFLLFGVQYFFYLL